MAYTDTVELALILPNVRSVDILAGGPTALSGRKLATRWLFDSFYPAARQAKLNIRKNLFGPEPIDDNLTVKGCPCMECPANRITPGRAWRLVWRCGGGLRPTTACAWLSPARAPRAAADAVEWKDLARD